MLNKAKMLVSSDGGKTKDELALMAVKAEDKLERLLVASKSVMGFMGPDNIRLLKEAIDYAN